MSNNYEFFIAGRARNRENILKICNIFDKYNISYYCFIKNENQWGFGNENQTIEEKQREFELLNLKSDAVLNLFKTDLEGEKSSKNLFVTSRKSCTYRIWNCIWFREKMLCNW